MYVKERMRLFWVRRSNSLLQRLSNNILREVCYFLDEPTLLPFYRNSVIGLFNVASHRITKYPESPQFPRGAVLCYLGDFKVLVVGQSTYTCLVTPSGLLSTAPMAESRYYPGSIRYAGFVYVFGGSSATPCTAEKYSVLTDCWSGLPRMTGSRYAFTPVLQERKIYLPEVNEASHLVEVFDTDTEVFTVLINSLPFAGYSSIAYIFEQELVIVDFNGRRARMQVQQGAEVHKDDLVVNGVECYSQCGPALLHRALFVAQYKTGAIVRLSIDSGAFEELGAE